MLCSTLSGFLKGLCSEGKPRAQKTLQPLKLLGVLFFALLLAASPLFSQTPIFINEIHYDNTGTDAGEAIEIAGPAGTDLTGWSIVLYNGSGGAVYDTDVLSGAIPDLGGGFGVVVLNYPSNGIQNGAPDGIALVNASNAVIQFLGYEGSFAAVGGPANGMMSTNIGVDEEPAPAAGSSLQLTGTGTNYEDFAWTETTANTFGAFNAGQTFAGAGDGAPSVASTSPGNNAPGVGLDADLTINFSEAVNVTGSWFSITGSSSGAHPATVSGGPQSFTLNPDVDFVNSEIVSVTIFAVNVSDQDADDPPDNMTVDFAFSFAIASGASGWVINEILADPDAVNGDANGDGTVNTSDDEFIELVNITGAVADLSGWTLSDGVSLRHTFPTGTRVRDQCAIVIFAGGAPTGAFGEAIVQTASAGQLGLNNAGDTVTLNNGNADVATYTYGAEGGDNQSLTRDPDITGSEPLVKHTIATDAGGRLFSPGTKVNGSTFSGCIAAPPAKEIFEIQGAGLVSSFAGEVVAAENNVVTAVGTEGFFMQTPAARSDGDAQTSDGIFVFTGALPAVSVGDVVNVSGQIAEFFDFTEFTNGPTVAIVSSGNPLPPAVQLDAATPSPNQPQSTTEFERFESMLVEIAAGVIAESNQSFSSDSVGELRIVAMPSRPFREPGIQFPGLPSLPVWDGNPEIFELDPDRLEQPNVKIPAGSAFSASGIMSYEFGGYEFWPTTYSFNSASLPQPVRPRATDEATIATLNLHLFYDSVDDPNLGEPVPTAAEYQTKLNKLSKYIREVLLASDILAVQEAENMNALKDLTDKIKNDDATLAYTPYLIAGNDFSGIDLGFLVHNSITVDTVVQFGATEIFTFDNTLLHDRPPLVLYAKLADGRPIAVMNLHLRSLNGIDDAVDGARVRRKRHEQATSVSLMVQSLQAGPDSNLVVTGDFNAFQFTDGYVDVLGQIIGAPADASQALISGSDQVNPDLLNEALVLPNVEQYSFIFRGSAQALDHMLVSRALHPAVTGVEYARGNSDAAENFAGDGSTALRASDHDGLVLYVKLTPTGIDDDEDKIASVVTDYDLIGNYPNPFNPSTTIAFALPEAGSVSLKIYSLTGQLVRQLASGKYASGRHTVTWNAKDAKGSTVATGMYFYQLVVQRENGETAFMKTRRMMLVK